MIVSVSADAVKSSRALGVGAVVGVVIAGALLVVVILFLLYLFLYRRPRRSKPSNGLLSHADFFSTGKEGKAAHISATFAKNLDILAQLTSQTALQRYMHPESPPEMYSKHS